VSERVGHELERIYRDEGGRLWRAVLAFAGDLEVTNDAVAEAFAQALRRGPAIREPLPWLWRAAFRIAAGELKDRNRMRNVMMDRPYEFVEPATDLVAALATLPHRQRAAIVLHHYAGHSTREIAAIIGSTPPAVRVYLYRGRKRLRELLGDIEDE
jgi:RNA polymerase sigma-70 factor (ECF subfamily)